MFKEFSPIDSPAVLERQELTMRNDAGSRCEDCPEVNPCPPNSSDCPSFEVSDNTPYCNQDGATKMLERMFAAPSVTRDLGEMTLPSLVELVETGASLPMFIA